MQRSQPSKSLPQRLTRSTAPKDIPSEDGEDEDAGDEEEAEQISGNEVQESETENEDLDDEQQGLQQGRYPSRSRARVDLYDPAQIDKQNRASRQRAVLPFFALPPSFFLFATAPGTFSRFF